MYIYMYIYIYIYIFNHPVSISVYSSLSDVKYPSLFISCWGCRIHRLLLCRGVRPPNKCPGL